MSQIPEIVPYHHDKLSVTIIKGVTVEKLLNEVDMTKRNKMIIIAAHANPKIKEIGKADSGDMLRMLINKAIFESGFGASWSDEDIQALILSVISDIFTSFSHLTIQEIQIAFHNGVREMYGEVMGLSVRLFYRWLASYVAKTKINANKELIGLNLGKKDELDDDEKEKRHKLWLESQFEDYNILVESGEYRFSDFGNLFYNYLDGFSLLKFTNKQKQEFMEEAKGIVRSKYSSSNARNDGQAMEFKRVIEKLTNNDKSMRGEIIAEAKRLALKKYLINLASKKENLRKLIQDAQDSDI